MLSIFLFKDFSSHTTSQKIENYVYFVKALSRYAHPTSAKNNIMRMLQKHCCNLNFGSNVMTTFLWPLFARSVITSLSNWQLSLSVSWTTFGGLSDKFTHIYVLLSICSSKNLSFKQRQKIWGSELKNEIFYVGMYVWYIYMSCFTNFSVFILSGSSLGFVMCALENVDLMWQLFRTVSKNFS